MLHPFDLAQRLKLIDNVFAKVATLGSRRDTHLADAVVEIDPTSNSEFPSSNRNRVKFFGCSHPVEPAHVDRILTLYEDEGVSRFFFWLEPTPQLEEIREWLVTRGMWRWEQTGYPVLLCEAREVAAHEANLIVQRVGPGEASRYEDDIQRIYGNLRFTQFFLDTCGASGIEHFLAFENDRVVSVSIMSVSDDLAYLGWMATAEEDRGKGGQSTLIVSRVSRAVELGCRWVASETLYLLEQSLNNLKRKGFEIVYEKEVYVYEKQ